MEDHITNGQFLVGTFVLALVLIFALAAYFEFRKRRAPKFRNFFAYEYDRNHLQNGSTRKTKMLRPLDRHSQLVNFHLREFAASEQRIGSSIGVQPDPE